MCSICNQLSCPTLCPNRREQGTHTCHVCGDGIVTREYYYQIGTSFFHKDCLLDYYDKDELLALFGAQPRMAEESSIALLILGDKDEK